MRWQDRKRSRLYVLLSWLLSAATVPNRRKTDVFLVDNLHVSPVLLKRLFLRRNQKIVVHLGSHTMYFLVSHRYKPLVERLHLWALQNYDAVICEGNMTVKIVEDALGKDHPPIFETYLGPLADRLPALQAVNPDLDGQRLVFIGSGPGTFRMHYKGLDLMIEAFSIAAKSQHEIELDIIGEWEPEITGPLLDRLPGDIRERVHFRGRSRDVIAWLERSALCLHCARGDAFPTSTIEAMTAGVVPLISEVTGTRQLVRDVSEHLIAPLDGAEIARRIAWYFALTSSERAELSDRSRTAAAPYTEQSATAHYVSTFAQMCRDIGLPAVAESRSV